MELVDNLLRTLLMDARDKLLAGSDSDDDVLGAAKPSMSSADVLAELESDSDGDDVLGGTPRCWALASDGESEEDTKYIDALLSKQKKKMEKQQRKTPTPKKRRDVTPDSDSDSDEINARMRAKRQMVEAKRKAVSPRSGPRQKRPAKTRAPPPVVLATAPPPAAADCVILGSRSAEERDAELRRAAISVDDSDAEECTLEDDLKKLSEGLEGRGFDVSVALKWCEENGADKLYEIVKAEMEDEFVASLALKPVKAKGLKVDLRAFVAGGR